MKFIEKKFICIQCPLGCNINVKLELNDNNNKSKMTNFKIIEISGNKCPKGEEYVKNEIINPQRIITTTVATIFPEFPRLPVKTDKEVPLKMIFKYMDVINKIIVKKRVKIGEIVKKNILGSNVNLVATSNIDDINSKTINNK